MRTKLADHSTGNSPGHSLGKLRLDRTLALYRYVKYGVSQRERVKFDQPYLSERITRSFKGIRLIHA